MIQVRKCKNATVYTNVISIHLIVLKKIIVVLGEFYMIIHLESILMKLNLGNLQI